MIAPTTLQHFSPLECRFRVMKETAAGSITTDHHVTSLTPLKLNCIHLKGSCGEVKQPSNLGEGDRAINSDLLSDSKINIGGTGWGLTL